MVKCPWCNENYTLNGYTRCPACIESQADSAYTMYIRRVRRAAKLEDVTFEQAAMAIQAGSLEAIATILYDGVRTYD
jgi:hypothetical protein